MPEITHSELPVSSAEGRHSAIVGDALFAASGVLFRLGLALVSFEQVRPLHIQLSDVFFLASLTVLPLSRRPVTAKLRARIPLGGPLILAGGVLSLFSSTAPADASGPFLKLFILFGLFLPLAITHASEVKSNFSFLVGGIGLNCLIALVQATMYPGITALLSINPPRIDISYSGRYQALTTHPNILGICAAFAVLVTVGRFLVAGSRPRKVLLALVVLLCAIGALLTGSRTFLAGFVPGLFAVAVLRRQRWRDLIKVTAGCAIMFLLIVYVVPGVFTRYTQRIENTGEDSDLYRVGMVLDAVEGITKKPILGWGVDRFGSAGAMIPPGDTEVLGAHNSLVQYWWALGALGATGFMLLFAQPMRQLLSAMKRHNGSQREWLSTMFGCQILLFIVSNLHPILYNRFFFVPLFLFAGYASYLFSLSTSKVDNRLPYAARNSALKAQTGVS